RPRSSRILFGGGAYMCVTMSPRLSSARIAPHWRYRLADVDHYWQVERRDRLLCTTQPLKIVAAGDVFRQPRLDAYNDGAIARHCPARQRYVCTVYVHQFATGETSACCVLSRARPICGPPRTTAAISSMLSGPPDPASTKPVTPSCSASAGESLPRPAW